MGRILDPLLDEFAKENRIEPTRAEVDTLVQKLDETDRQRLLRYHAEKAKLARELRDPAVSAGDRKKKEERLKKVERFIDDLETRRKLEQHSTEAREESRAAARSLVTPWKVNQALYRKYGGRVAHPSRLPGGEPLDAHRDFLREQEAKGTFRLVDEWWRAEFWGYLTNDTRHTFYSQDEGARHISTPWWLWERPPAVPERKGQSR